MSLVAAARRFKRPDWPGPSLILISDRDRLPDPRAAMARLPKGAGVILRHCPSLAFGLKIAALARFRRLILIVAGDWRLAARLGAQGLHLPEAAARRGLVAGSLGWRKRRGALLSVAAHSVAALGAAKRLGADMVLLSPAFATNSHPGASFIGAVRFGLWARQAGLPVLALGGIDARSAQRLPKSSARGLAAIGALAG